MTFRWFLSGQVREATDAVAHVHRVLNAQRDILTPQAIEAVETVLADTKRVIDSDPAPDVLKKQIDELERVGGKWLKPYPNADWRENIEVFLVAIAVAMAIRTFFLQPFKIPTGSMQPTLYGVTTENYRNQPEVKFPNGLKRIWDGAVHGTFYHHMVAEADMELVDIRATTVARFINKHELLVREKVGDSWVNKTLSIWFSPDERFQSWAGLRPGQTFRKGEDLFKLVEVTGDHLFVDRVTYNFRRPERGDIVVFATKGIANLEQNLFYIKRLTALGGEKVSIGMDRHLRIDGKRLDASTPHFENLYNFDPSQPPHESQYSGHVPYGMFVNPDFEFQVRTNHLFVCGDNTMNSYDSRAWGDFPRENVIGKSFFVYWPISNRGGSRFGLGYR